MNDWKPVRANKLQGESFFPVHPCRADQVSSISCVPSLSPWRGRPAAYRLPAAREDGLATAILVQGVKGGRVIGVGRPKTAGPTAKAAPAS